MSTICGYKFYLLVFEIELNTRRLKSVSRGGHVIPSIMGSCLYICYYRKATIEITGDDKDKVYLRMPYLSAETSPGQLGQ